MERNLLQLVIPKGTNPQDPYQPIDVIIRHQEEVLRLYANSYGKGVFEVEHE